MQTHRYSFFGQKTAMIFQSGDWGDPCSFLTFIKKRDAGSWEKLAEGKTVKLSLPEIVALRAVVAGERPEWKAFHKSNGAGTPISARRESSKEDKGSPTVLIAAGDYLRPITYPETVILEQLLEHVFEEKIAHATGTTTPRPAPEASPQPEPAIEVPEGPTSDVEEEPPVEAIANPTPEDADMTLAESLAKFNIPPLPRRLPSGVFPMSGHLKEIRTEHGTTTLSLKLASGTIEEIPVTDIVGAGVHGSIVDLVIRMIPSPKVAQTPPVNPPPAVKPAAKRGKASIRPEGAPAILAAREIDAAPATPESICATSVKRITERALLVTNASGSELWVPKTALADAIPAPAVPQETAWQFAVKPWFAEKPDFQNWVKSI